LLFGVFAVLLVVALGRASYLGLFRSSALRAAATSQQVEKTVVPAVRGEITDRNGVVFALSEPADEIVADPLLINKTYKHPQAVADKLAPLLGISKLTTLALISKPNSQYVVLAPDVSTTTATRIAAIKIGGTTGINGINMEPTEHRAYPRGVEAGQVLGWAGADGHGDGLEYVFNRQLAGVNGKRETVIDANGKPISVDTPKAMVPGKNLALTISAPLQSEVESVLAGVGAQFKPAGATAIVTDPQTDQILALANWPSVNPNNVPSSAWSQVGGHVPAAEDQAVDMSYEPGSTFKAITVAGALEDHVVTPDTPIPVPSYLDPYGKKITDAEPHGDETLSVANILAVSSNIGADEIAQRMGTPSFAKWVNRFGFGKQTGVALEGEQTGVVPALKNYSGVSIYNLPFGQGLEVTPMQMVQAYDAIADGGILRSPDIVDSIGGKKVAAPKGKRIISTGVAYELRNMLRGVLADGGTASGAAIPGYDMAGKTGTASVVVNGKYSKSDYIASFIGMVPASDPKLVVAVVVDAPQTDIYGGSVAAPAFQKIVGWAVPHFGIDPCPPKACPASAMNPATPSTP
jgi:cell division protein FtsI/penicillin-binding protein 2